ncbi:MAG: DUF1080 domain-containing protein [Cytophagales bacterium]|nr:DUF1080 domain-containing protein [Cytophagales bacterium]
MRYRNLVPILLIVNIFSCSQDEKTPESLFNGKDLTGWDTYLGPIYDSVKGDFDSLQSIGLNNDPNEVFTIVTENEAPAIRISGENFGGISTNREFQNYHLSLQFKWGTQRWHPRKDKKRDSGLLYHAVGTHGADYGFWMRSQEFQIQEGDCGDYWGVAGGSFEITARKQNEEYVYDPTGELILFNEANQQVGRRCIKMPDAEKPTGQWNTIELYVLGDTAVHIVNGVTNMILYHSSQLESGKLLPLKKGKIQLQSEGAEIFYRKILIEPIQEISTAVLK